MTQEEIIFDYAMSLDGWELEIYGKNISNVYSKQLNDIKFEIETGVSCYLYVNIDGNRCYISTPSNCRKKIEDKAKDIILKIKEQEDIKYRNLLEAVIQKIK